MVGKQVIKSPDVLKQMVAQGCEVANHTYDHTLMTKVAPVELANQLVATNQVVSDACGISPVLMRPCGGAKTVEGMNIAGAISMPAISGVLIRWTGRPGTRPRRSRQCLRR